MVNFLIRLLITCGVIYLAQVLLDSFNIRQPAHKIIFIVVTILMVLWLVAAPFLNLPLA